MLMNFAEYSSIKTLTGKCHRGLRATCFLDFPRKLITIDRNVSSILQIKIVRNYVRKRERSIKYSICQLLEATKAVKKDE